MSKQGIAVDIDDVIVSHLDAFVSFSNKFYGTDMTTDDYNDEWGLLWSVDDAEVKKRAKEFHQPESVMNYPIFDDAIDALNKLKDKYDLYIVTARPDYLESTTHEWVNKYFKDMFIGVHFVPVWVDSKATKAQVCKQIGADYLIDDSVSHCDLAAKAGIKAVLFGDYKWNHGKEIADGVTRCKNWDEVVSYFCK